MKKKVDIILIFKTLSVVLVLLTLLLSTSCKEKGLQVIVYDYETQEVLNTINTIADEEKVLSISNVLIKGGENPSQDISDDTACSVLLKDPKDSTYDMWFKVVFDNGTAYSKYDFEKMDEEYVNTLKEMDITDEYGECTEMTAAELEYLLFT